MKPGIYIGIDPGWKNLGMAELEVDGGKVSLIRSTTLDPSVYKDVPQFVNDCLFSTYSSDIVAITIERMVPFNGQATSEAEIINHLIGAIKMKAYVDKIPYFLTRSIDWKVRLVKYLYKTCNFSNPSVELDKKFSMAAANAILTLGKDKHENDKPKITHHEADAICLAYCPAINLVGDEKKQ